ncbi:MAG: ABC transporter ATP-binding protein [Candidatus Azobacteroides sp.]|nr:ABC transporter ATP-binding protein [Candidatus Azobacteroides sp.]
MNKLIDIKNLYAGYENKVVIHNLSFSVEEKDFLCISGPNGSGKTTLIKALLGLLPITKGNIYFYRNGVNVPKINIGYLPQLNVIDRNFPISVKETVLSGLAGKEKWKRRFSPEEKEQVTHTLHQVGMFHMKKYPIGQLSGGQLQRVLLARAIVSAPEVIILDEPDTYMDKEFKMQLVDILRKINQQTAIILISHEENAFSTLIKHSLYIGNR